MVFSLAPGHRVDLVAAINTVCSESPYMATTRFEPTPAWMHALDTPDCQCHCILTIQDTGRIIGWCRMFPANRNEALSQVELGVGLLAPYRLCGLGTLLVRQALGWASQTGYETAILQVHPDNAVARHVFERCGFEYDGMVGGLMTMIRHLRHEEQYL